MQGLGYVLFFPLFTLGAFAIVAYLYLTWSIERRLESRHHAIWTSLGRPHLVINNALRTSTNLHRFLRSLKAGEIDDQKLHVRIRYWRRMRAVVAAVFLAMAAALLLDLVIFL
jgi:hypothetical protein